MDVLSANEAKTHFGDMLLKAQRAPIQINKNGKPVAVVISVEEYESIEALKLRVLQSRAVQAKADMQRATWSMVMHSLMSWKLAYTTDANNLSLNPGCPI